MQFWPTISWALLVTAALLAVWAVLADRPKGRLRCPGGWRRAFLIVPWRQGCWYDMSGVVDGAKGAQAENGGVDHRCPECGRPWKSLSELRRRRVRYRVLPVVALMLIGAYLASVAWRIRAYGWKAATPYWAIVMFAPIDKLVDSALGDWTALNGSGRWEHWMLSETLGKPTEWECSMLAGRLERAIAARQSENADPHCFTVRTNVFRRDSWWDTPVAFDYWDRSNAPQQAAFAAFLCAWTEANRGMGMKMGPYVLGMTSFYGDADTAREAAIVMAAIGRHGRRPGVFHEYPPTGDWPKRTIEMHDVGRIAPHGLRL